MSQILDSHVFVPFLTDLRVVAASDVFRKWTFPIQVSSGQIISIIVLWKRAFSWKGNTTNAEPSIWFPLWNVHLWDMKLKNISADCVVWYVRWTLWWENRKSWLSRATLNPMSSNTLIYNRLVTNFHWGMLVQLPMPSIQINKHLNDFSCVRDIPSDASRNNEKSSSAYILITKKSWAPIVFVNCLSIKSCCKLKTFVRIRPQ